jgi:hypothetical protein
MARSRKLFPSYGSALATNFLTMLERDRVVNRFVAGYVAEYDRKGILGGPARDRELADTIGRETIMAMIHRVHRALPRFFGKREGALLGGAEQQASDAFFQELMNTLGRALDWNNEDRRKFRRDLDMYSKFGARQTKFGPAKVGARPAKATDTRKRAKGQGEEPPFVGRVALLLDPSMLDQARRAARKFYVEVGKLTQQQLRKTLRPVT